MTKILIDTGASPRGWHRIESAAHCPTLFALRQLLRRYYMGQIPWKPPMDIASPHLIRGTLGHIGLAHYYARLGDMQHHGDPERFFDPEMAVDAKVARMEAAQEPGYLLAQQLAAPVKLALRAYIAEYAGEQLQVHGVEHVVSMQFEGYEMTQRVDLEIEDRSGRIWFFDHKFVGRADSHTMARYVLSGQFLEMYHQGRNAYGDRFGGIRVNLIGMGALKVKASGELEQPTIFEFRRGSPGPAPHALAAFPTSVAYWERQIAAWEAEFGDDVWRYPKALSELVCMTPYGKCPAWEICQWGPEGLRK